MVKENMWTARSIQVPDLDSVIKDVPARVCDNCGEYSLPCLVNMITPDIKEWAVKYKEQLTQDWELARYHDELKWIPPLE